MGRDGSPKRSPRKRSRLASRKGEQAPRPPFTAPDPWEQYYSNNPALQPTASRARSLLFERLLLARSRQLNGNPLGAPTHTSSRERRASRTTNSQTGNRVYTTDTESRRPDKKESYQ